MRNKAMPKTVTIRLWNSAYNLRRFKAPHWTFENIRILLSPGGDDFASIAPAERVAPYMTDVKTQLTKRFVAWPVPLIALLKLST